MRAINKIDSPAREKVLSTYDQVINWGKEEERFHVFKNGVSMGMTAVQLITLTEVSEETARTWYALLSENPEAELPRE